MNSVVIIMTPFINATYLSMFNMRENEGKKRHCSESDLELLCAFARLQTDDDVADGFSVATHGILSLTGGQLCYLSFIHLLCFFDTQS